MTMIQQQGAYWSFAAHFCNLQITKYSTLKILTKRLALICVL